MNTRVHVKAHASQLKMGPITSRTLLDLFPFGLILNHDMQIIGAGEKIVEVWSTCNENRGGQAMMGALVTDSFKLLRPKGITLSWSNV